MLLLLKGLFEELTVNFPHFLTGSPCLIMRIFLKVFLMQRIWGLFSKAIPRFFLVLMTWLHLFDLSYGLNLTCPTVYPSFPSVFLCTYFPSPHLIPLLLLFLPFPPFMGTLEPYITPKSLTSHHPSALASQPPTVQTASPPLTFAHPLLLILLLCLPSLALDLGTNTLISLQLECSLCGNFN